MWVRFPPLPPIAQEQEATEYQFRSPEFQLLGERFLKVCDSHGLEAKDTELLDSILVEFEWFGGLRKFGEKMKMAVEKTANNPRRTEIIVAMFKINLAFLDESPTSPVGNLAKRFREN